MRALRYAPYALLLAATASHADSCDAVKATIEARMRDAGLANFTLVAVDVAASAPGRTVGNCAGGAKKIVQTSAATASAPTGAVKTATARREDPILTECKDGTMSVGGTCKK